MRLIVIDISTIFVSLTVVAKRMIRKLSAVGLIILQHLINQRVKKYEPGALPLRIETFYA